MKAFVAVISTLAACSQAQLLATPYNYGYAPYNNLGYAPYNLGYAAPYAAAYNYAPYTAAPVAVPAPIQAPSSQFQAQDEFGNLNYGYTNINSQKHEVGNAYGGVTGAYSYVDPNGELQRVEYVADALGFRVKGTNIPVAPAAPAVPEVELPVAPVYNGVAPTAPEDTPEVKAAKAEFFEAFDKEAKREKRDAQFIAAPYAYNGLNAYPYASAYGYNYAAPYAYATALVAKDEETPAATQKAELATIAAPAPVAYAGYAPHAYAYAPNTYGYATYANAPFYGYNGYNGYAGFPYTTVAVAPAKEE